MNIEEIEKLLIKLTYMTTGDKEKLLYMLLGALFIFNNEKE